MLAPSAAGIRDENIQKKLSETLTAGAMLEARLASDHSPIHMYESAASTQAPISWRYSLETLVAAAAAAQSGFDFLDASAPLNSPSSKVCKDLE